MGKKYDRWGVTSSGEKIALDVIDGISYLTGTKTRPPENTTVETGGGIYKLVNGHGVKVNKHNDVKKANNLKSYSTSTREKADRIKEKVELGIVDDPMIEKTFQMFMKPFEWLGLTSKRQYEETVMANRQKLEMNKKLEEEYRKKYENYDNTIFEKENKLASAVNIDLFSDEQYNTILKVVLLTVGAGFVIKIFK